MTDRDRREFLKRAGLALGAWPSLIQSALAVPADRRTGSIMDVEHVVILMQENRSFDHYFGMLRGVRGFADPRPVTLPSGKPVWHQPAPDGRTITPFHLDSVGTAAQWLPSLDHNWKGSHALWQHHDAWIAAKGPMTMGYFSRADMPFYYALADAFTICDAYHCSIFGPTNPNRLFLFSGTNGLAVGNDGPQAVANPSDEVNETADQMNDAKAFAAYRWTTYAERLSAAGIDWRVYQEYDNFGDNALAYFARFRDLDPATDSYRRARHWADGSNAANAKQSFGEHLAADFAKDVAAGTLPQVSWIVAPTIASEHPESPPAVGQALVAKLLGTLAAHPDVWAKTVFILNYDENDGFFDHVPPPVPAITPAMGKSTIDVTGEIYKGEPVGLGPRVPMLIISPWTKGGFVNSEVFDHTSVIRFLETRFGVAEPNITPWRRAVCGNLVSAFDFTAADKYVSSGAALPDTSDYVAKVTAARGLPPAVLTQAGGLPVQEKGQRPARSLPYILEVTGIAGDGLFTLTIVNQGTAGACFAVYADGDAPRLYTCGAGQTLTDRLPVVAGNYGFRVHGPNGFLRVFANAAPVNAVEVQSRYDDLAQELVIQLHNPGPAATELIARPLAYIAAPSRRYQLAPGQTRESRWAIAASDHWYDIELRSGAAIWRLAGHMETGRPSRSDPAMG
ncbi:MAG: phospholipase C, phosphocholine-specific [Pseudomonadota bacterium]